MMQPIIITFHEGWPHSVERVPEQAIEIVCRHDPLWGEYISNLRNEDGLYQEDISRGTDTAALIADLQNNGYQVECRNLEEFVDEKIAERMRIES